MMSKLQECTHGSETAVRLQLDTRIMSRMEVLAMFLSEAIHFYNVPLVDVAAGLRFCCEQEPFNFKDSNIYCCFVLFVVLQISEVTAIFCSGNKSYRYTVCSVFQLLLQSYSQEMIVCKLLLCLSHGHL